MAENQSNYQKSIEELEEIIATLEDGVTDIDDMATKVTRATEILLNCREKLFQIEQEVEKFTNVES